MRNEHDADVTLSDALKRKRDELGTWAAVAVAVRTSEANVSRWSKGGEPTPEFYDPLCAFLEVDIDTLGALIIRDQLRRWQRQ